MKGLVGLWLLSAMDQIVMDDHYGNLNVIVGIEKSQCLEMLFPAKQKAAAA